MSCIYKQGYTLGGAQIRARTWLSLILFNPISSYGRRDPGQIAGCRLSDWVESIEPTLFLNSNLEISLF